MGNTDSRNARKVRRAIRQNDAATLRKLVLQKVDLDLALNHYSRNTPLILAACYASVDVIPVLINSCRDKDAYNAEGHTALDKGIMFYSLANEYHPHKTKELLRRRRIVQLLIDGGVTRVRSAELELWIRVNKSDPVFLHTVTHLFCRSSSVALKSIGFAVMLRINADITCSACFLEAGATYRHYKLMYLTDLPSIDYKMPVNLAILILQSTSDTLILHHIENIFLSAYPATRMKEEAREQILLLLLQNDHSVRYDHQKQYPEYDGLITYHHYMLKSLKWLCRTVIRRHAYPNAFYAVHQLKLPSKLENYLLLNEDGDGEDPTLNASKNLNMGSNPPSAQVVRRRTLPPNDLSNTEHSQLRGRPFSHCHPADEIERRRHRFSHSSAPSSPICPTASLAATSDWSGPVKRRNRNQNGQQRQRPKSQAVARRDMPIIQLSPKLTRYSTSNLEGQKKETQEVDGKQLQQEQSKSEKLEKIKVIQERRVNQKPPQITTMAPATTTMSGANKENTPITARKSPRIPVRQGPVVSNRVNVKAVNDQTKSPRQVVRKTVVHSTPQTTATIISSPPTQIVVERHVIQVAESRQRVVHEKAVKVTPRAPPPPPPVPVMPKERTNINVHDMSVSHHTDSTKVVSSINQPVLSTFAPQVRPSMSPRRSPRDAKRPRPHSHFIPASEVRNIFPPPNMSPQNDVRSQDGSLHINTSMMSDDRMTQSYSPGKLSDHIEYDSEFASHLEEALMKRRSQPPGHFLPTKEVLIDFGTPSSSPLHSRSAGSTLTRQEVLLRPGSASLPRSDSNRRRSRQDGPPSSPFNLKVNPRFIVAASNSNGKIKTPPSERACRKNNNSDSENDYDEIDDSSSDSEEEGPVNENEGYTRF